MPPTFPQPYQSTVSHWQATNRGPTSLWNHGRSAKLPTTKVVDYVIIGAGASGTSLAYELSRAGAAGDGKSIVILDAKDVASGASGRNGGHVAPFGWGILTSATAPQSEGGAGLTPEQAVEMMFFEQDNLDYVEKILKKEGIDADFWRGDRYEVITTPNGAAQNVQNYELMQSIIAKTPRYKNRAIDWELITDPVEARRLSRIKNALQCNRVPGGSWHPHRGVTGLMRVCLESKTSDVQFFSWAPVAGLKHNSDGTIAVDCGVRGTVTARNVVIATNGYTRHVLPEMDNLLVPLRANAGLVTPPVTYSGERALKGTYSVIEDGPYLIQTPHSGFVLGPFTHALLVNRMCKPTDIYDIDNDSTVLPAAHEWLENYCRDYFVGWGKEGPSEGLARSWCGVICHSVDLLPFVGPFPNRPNLWIAAGYNGHGMAMILNITRGMANHMKTGTWDRSVPRFLRVTEDRLERAAECIHPLDYPLSGLVYPYREKAKI